jgi:hypothetical protein
MNIGAFWVYHSHQGLEAVKRGMSSGRQIIRSQVNDKTVQGFFMPHARRHLFAAVAGIRFCNTKDWA